MRKILTTFSVFVLLILSTSVFAEDGNSKNISNNLETVSCFDYYTFGSVEADFSARNSNAVSGMTMDFYGNIKNNNPYPVVEGTLYVKIFKNIGSEKNPNGPDVVDQFVAMDNINLPADGSIPANFSWDIPAYATTGDYRLVTYFTSDKKFNLLGLSFTDDVVGNTFDFNVLGQESILMFDKTSFIVNDEPYYFAAFPSIIQSTDNTGISLSIDNTTNQPQSAQVTWKLYAWDAISPENLVREFTTNTQVKANSKEEVGFLIPEKEAPVYLLVGELKYKDAKSFVGVRFVRDGIDQTKLNFPAVTSYPLIKGQQATLFTCLHNSGQSDQVKNNRVVLEVLDDNGKIIESYSYKGIVTGEMMAVKKDFISKTNLDTFSVHASLYTDEKLVDESTMEYNCKDLDPTKCTEEKKISTFQTITGVIALILLLIIFILIKRKTKGVELLIILFVFTAGVLMFDVGVKDLKAKDVTYSFFRNETLYGAIASIDDYFMQKIYMYVKYKVQIENIADGSIIDDNSVVNVGSIIRLRFLPHEYTDISWNATGFAYSTPYGEWIQDAARPANICASKNFFRKSYAHDSGGGGVYISQYADLVVSPPVKSITEEVDLIGPKMSCGDLEGNDTEGYYRDCEIKKSGQIDLSFNFESTFGKFHAAYNSCNRVQNYVNGNYGPEGTLTSDSKLKNTFILDVPLQSILYTLNAEEVPLANNPPNPPTITETLNNGMEYNYQLIATDPNTGDKIFYQIDWTDDGIDDIHQTLPSTVEGVLQGTSQNTDKTWTSLSQTFRARTIDQYGATSAWATHTTCPIDQSLISGTCTSTLSLICQASNNILIASGLSTGGPGSVSVVASGGTSPYTYTYVQGGNPGTGSLYSTSTVSSTGLDSWAIPVTFTVADGNATTSKTCSVTVTDQNIVTTPTSPSTFYFSPNIADSGFCPFYLNISGVSECELHNRIGTKSAGPFGTTTSPDTITIELTEGEKAPIGTHTLWCITPTDSVPKQYGTAESCYSNSDVKER